MKAVILTVYDKLSENGCVGAVNSKVTNPPLGCANGGSVNSEGLV
jgi:hypothetical protein